MKKALTTLVTGLVALGLAGCADPPQQQTTTTGPEPIVTVRSYKACLVTDDAAAGDGSPVQQALNGLDRAQRELSIDIARIASAPADHASSLQSMVDADCQLVVGLGSTLGDAVEAAARLNPDVHFALVDAIPSSAQANLRPVFFDVHESAYLAGYLAASRSSSGKVGAFGGLNIPAVTIYLDGFAQGVARYNQDKSAQVQLLGWDMNTQDGTFVRSGTDPWRDAQAGRAAASWLAEQGADVVLAVAGESGVGALQLARESGSVKVIWSDTDGCLTQAAHCEQLIGSVVKDRGAAVFAVINADHAGRAAEGVFAATLRNEGTALVPARPGEIGPETSDELDQLAKAIIDGRIRVTSPAAIG